MIRNIFHTYPLARSVVLLPVILLFGLQSCKRDFPEVFPTQYNWEPFLAFPIGEVEFGLRIPSGFDTLLLEIDPVSGRPYWDLLDSIPMSGGIDFDFEEVLGKREEINMAILRFNTYNGFPIEAEIQGYVEDEYGTVIDSLFNPLMVMERGELLSGGETARYEHTMKEVYFDAERLDILLQAKYFRFKGRMSSVAYFPEYIFIVQIGAVLGIKSDL
ncbi:MAG: hypothetical protein K9J30_05675 [Bacteroidales bacterium]|nr:hypothetical protein [Bacteroidales bacterium]